MEIFGGPLMEICGGPLTDFDGGPLFKIFGRPFTTTLGGLKATEGALTEIEGTLLTAIDWIDGPLFTDIDGIPGPPPIEMEGMDDAGGGGGLVRSRPLSGIVIEDCGCSLRSAAGNNFFVVNLEYGLGSAGTGTGLESSGFNSTSFGFQFCLKLTIGRPGLSDTMFGRGSFGLRSFKLILVAFRMSSPRISRPSFIGISSLTTSLIFSGLTGALAV